MLQFFEQAVDTQQLKEVFVSDTDYWISYQDDYGFDESEVRSFSTLQDLIEFIEEVGEDMEVEILELEEALSMWIELEDISE